MMWLVKKKNQQIQDGRLTDVIRQIEFDVFTTAMCLLGKEINEVMYVYVSVIISNLRWLALSETILISNSNSTFIVLNLCPRLDSKAQETKT